MPRYPSSSNRHRRPRPIPPAERIPSPLRGDTWLRGNPRLRGKTGAVAGQDTTNGRDVFHIRLASTATSTPRVLEVLAGSAGAINVTVIPASAFSPDGDVVECDLEPVVANEVIHRLRALGPLERGPISVSRAETAIIRSGHETLRPPVSDREVAPVWEVVDATIRANASYPFSFYGLLVSAGLLAAVGILTNSQILIVAAMVVGPEYNAILGVSLGITEGNRRPVRRGLIALGLGFALAVAATLVFATVIHGTGQTPRDYLLGFRPVSDLISKPNLFSVIVAVVAGLVGVVSILEARANALIGVFISVTTIPAAAAMGVSAAYEQWSEMWGATEQLLLNVVILLAVGSVTLVVQRRFWKGRETRSRRIVAGDRPDPTTL
jgi:uncharacterized hydrophobic protein (TIGR00271 family)